jgi:predicted kinase
MAGVVASQLRNDVQRLRQSLGPLPKPVTSPALIVLSGLPGTGKSYFSRKLAGVLDCVTLESDALRKVLFPAPDYSAVESARLFRAMHLLIEQLLKAELPVIMDATNLSERFRERLYRIADRLEARLVLVRVEAPVGVVRERLQGRRNGADPQDMSDADWGVYQKLKPTVERIRRQYYTLDSSRDITPVLEKIAREVRR